MILSSEFEVLMCWTIPCIYWSVGLWNCYLQILKRWYVKLPTAYFEVLVCWGVTNIFRIIYLLIYYRFLSVLLNCYSQILERCSVELFPTDFEELFCCSFTHMPWSAFVALLPTYTYFEVLGSWTAAFWSVGLLNSSRQILKCLFCCSVTHMPCKTVCWNITHIFWSLGFLNCYPHVLKCCMLNYYPHVRKCWFVELFPVSLVAAWYNCPLSPLFCG